MKHATAIADNIMAARAKRRKKPAQSIAKVEAAVPAVTKREDVDDVIQRLLEKPSKENVDLIERLLGMRAERAFNVDLRAVQEELPRIMRDAKNDTTRSRYARLESVAQIVNPIANKHGFTLSFGSATSPLPNHYRVTCRLSHIAGHHRDYEADIPADSVGMKGSLNKTPTHAMGSAMSYGRRYLMLLMFNIVLTNEDDDGQAAGSSAPISSEQYTKLKDLIVEADLHAERFCKRFKITALGELPAHKYDEAVGAIENYKTQKAAS